MVNAENNVNDILRALEAGEFYSSCGPEIYDFYVEDNKAIVECSAGAKIRLQSDKHPTRIIKSEDGKKSWKYLQAYWLNNADKAYEMVKALYEYKGGELDVTALVEDGMFEESIMFIVALYSEMLWDVNCDLKEMINEVALRGYVDFA